VVVKVRIPQAQGEFANDSAIELTTGSQRQRTQAGAPGRGKEICGARKRTSPESSSAQDRQLAPHLSLRT
jgi:hypothetical protein